MPEDEIRSLDMLGMTERKRGDAFYLSLMLLKSA